MKFSQHDIGRVIALHIAEWTRRSEAPMVAQKGRGCFVWNAEEHAQRPNSGMFYTYDMLSDYFHEETAYGLRRLIENADLQNEVVVALVFNDKARGFRLRKSKTDETEIVE